MLKSDLLEARFEGADLTYADFTHADVSGANFTGATLFRARFHKTIETDTIGRSKAVALGDDRELAEAEAFLQKTRAMPGGSNG